MGVIPGTDSFPPSPPTFQGEWRMPLRLEVSTLRLVGRMFTRVFHLLSTEGYTGFINTLILPIRGRCFLQCDKSRPTGAIHILMSEIRRKARGVSQGTQVSTSGLQEVTICGLKYVSGTKHSTIAPLRPQGETQSLLFPK